MTDTGFPSAAHTLLKLTPAAMTRTITSNAPGSGSSISSTANASLGSPSRSWRITHAAIVAGSSPGPVSSCEMSRVPIAIVPPKGPRHPTRGGVYGAADGARRARAAIDSADHGPTDRPLGAGRRGGGRRRALRIAVPALLRGSARRVDLHRLGVLQQGGHPAGDRGRGERARSGGRARHQDALALSGRRPRRIPRRGRAPLRGRPAARNEPRAGVGHLGWRYSPRARIRCVRRPRRGAGARRERGVGGSGGRARRAGAVEDAAASRPVARGHTAVSFPSDAATTFVGPMEASQKPQLQLSDATVRLLADRLVIDRLEIADERAARVV